MQGTEIVLAIELVFWNYSGRKEAAFQKTVFYKLPPPIPPFSIIGQYTSFSWATKFLNILKIKIGINAGNVCTYPREFNLWPTGSWSLHIPGNNARHIRPQWLNRNAGSSALGKTKELQQCPKDFAAKRRKSCNRHWRHGLKPVHPIISTEFTAILLEDLSVWNVYSYLLECLFYSCTRI